MLAAAFVSWIERIPERAFDAPFLDLLRAQGFYDIHFTHGAYEFGKDFVAKRDEPTPTQYAFQAKAGDIGGGAWDDIFSQLLELSAGERAHPNFDASLPRKSVLVTTGRLIGKATIGATQLRELLRDARRGSFEVWDIDVLKEMLAGSARFAVAPVSSLLPVLGYIESGIPNDRELERYLAALSPPSTATLNEVRRAFVDNSLPVARLLDKERPFLALFTALNGVRIAAGRVHTSPAEGADLLGDAFEHYIELGKRLFAPLLAAPEDPDAWMDWAGGAHRIVNYPVACAKVLEFLGLAALHREYQGKIEEAGELAGLAARVAVGQPGAAHPISDRFAATYPPTITALSRLGYREQASLLLRRTAKWLCDCYEASPFGLAGPHSTPEEEVRTLLGTPFDAITLRERRESLLAVALADSAYTMLPSDYASVVNDILAVGIIPSALHPNDVADAYVVGGASTRALINIRYPDTAGSAALAHHSLQIAPRAPEQAGGPAVPLAIGCITRDRLFTDVLQRLLTTPLPTSP